MPIWISRAWDFNRTQGPGRDKTPRSFPWVNKTGVLAERFRRHAGLVFDPRCLLHAASKSSCVVTVA